MPGGRLTHEDRRDIASWLTGGLGYAEIARRLGRPTSTVSREVTRNGGTGGYRADGAQRATGRRARRGKPAAGVPAPAHGAAFVEEFAALMVRTGLPKMAARVFASLVTTDAGTLTSAELVGLLRVSPASVSKAIGYLEGLELVSRDRDPSRRRERYRIDDDVWLRTWLTSARTNATLADLAKRGTAVFDPATPAGARLERMRGFFEQLSADMAGGPATDDPLTVFAALVHARAPLTAESLAAGLGWPRSRTEEALAEALRLCDSTDPIVLRRVEPDAYAVAAHPTRLTAAQREALGS